ncbi:peroxisomal membrane protein PEX13-like [Harmonia axyridis]|uniref:peroxisomal membrane protein PEX13-like n=1 Tax=Harmonia axyridis TaxID=115357 RepID=UPI001E277F2C|nr:peroxisomal membrane protein PEX13-like [Harmonia axyridis]
MNPEKQPIQYFASIRINMSKFILHGTLIILVWSCLHSKISGFFLPAYEDSTLIHVSTGNDGPDYAPPGYGSPGYGSQRYGPPGYGSPGYGSQGYGRPEYGYGGYPSYADSEPTIIIDAY